ncbi:MAG: FAD-binding protein [Solirubrobacteraceae bacterium]
MPLAERTPAVGGRATTGDPQLAVVSGWGRIGSAAVTVLRPAHLDTLCEGVAAVAAHSVPSARSEGSARGARGAIARGMGRSYGDAAQRHGGVVVDTTAMTGFEVDGERGLVHAQAGVTLGRLLAALAPAGWVLPVVPGTQHVTVGGAIAADIHGKNHGSAGTFGAHVTALGLVTASGELCELTRDGDAELLAATIGGMGLTGVIVWASIALRRLPSPMLSVDTDRIERLDDALALLDGPGGEHRVAWLDLLGPVPARGIVTRAAPVDDPDARPDARAGATTVATRLTVPARWPGGLLRPGLVRAHNAFRFRAAPRSRTGALQSYGAHMFPLDGLGAWPRLYGGGGLVQYQLVVPKGREDVLERVIGELRRSAVPCYLAVLKDFGAEGDALLSFPLQGWTLALDVPGGAPGLAALLDVFDGWVAGAGGRVYLAKDGRVRPEALAAMYPRLERWRAIRDRHDPDGVWASDLGVRTGLVAGPR